jgi:hypothetical protein
MNYHAMFTSLRKRVSHGLSFTLNWTWSHALDTAGQAFDANAGPVSNPFDPSFDYGDAFTDVRHVVQGYGTYDLPLPQTNRFTSGWSTSFIYTARTGFPLSVHQGGDIFGNFLLFGNAPETVPARGSLDLNEGVHGGVAGSGGVGIAGDPATGGTGLNLFSDPEAVFNNFRHFLLSKDKRGNRGSVRGLGFWNLDFSVRKRTRITESTDLVVSVDFFNIFNHPHFNNPGDGTGMSFLSPSNFGVISSQATGDANAADFAGPRRIQFGLRFEF